MTKESEMIVRAVIGFAYLFAGSAVMALSFHLFTERTLSIRSHFNSQACANRDFTLYNGAGQYLAKIEAAEKKQ